ncbi:proteasome assembly chaperone 4 domain-containing protein [Sarocladium implicatum]|nr:proteasome assembly chaperone 4 domain-containing protein [Sarocladium implicatum]
MSWAATLASHGFQISAPASAPKPTTASPPDSSTSSSPSLVARTKPHSSLNHAASRSHRIMAVESQSRTTELSMLLPKALDTKIHIRLSSKAKAIMLNLTTASPDELANAANMVRQPDPGSQRYEDTQPLSTVLYPHEPTLEFATRIAKILARKLQLPIYVTNSISFANAGMGGTVEEEMEAFRAIVQIVLQQLQDGEINGAAADVEGLKLQ